MRETINMKHGVSLEYGALGARSYSCARRVQLLAASQPTDEVHLVAHAVIGGYLSPATNVAVSGQANGHTQPFCEKQCNCSQQLVDSLAFRQPACECNVWRRGCTIPERISGLLKGSIGLGFMRGVSNHMQPMSATAIRPQLFRYRRRNSEIS